MFIYFYIFALYFTKEDELGILNIENSMNKGRET